MAVVIAVPILYASAAPRQEKSPANLNKELHTIQGEVTKITIDTQNPVNSTIVVINGNDKETSITANATTRYYIVDTGKFKQTIGNRLSNLKNWINRRLGKEDVDTDKITIPENWGNQLGKLGPSCKEASFADLSVGDRIIARVDKNKVANRIIIINTPVIQQVKGNVTIYADTITVKKTDGTTVGPLKWDVNTRFIIKGTLDVPNSGKGMVIYNSETMKAQLVNLVSEEEDKS
jgi:hypothetical protein